MTEERKFRDLKKSLTDKKLTGVCGGFGEYTPLSSWMWRVIFVISAFFGGFGLLTYVVLWIAMPAGELARYEKPIN